MAELRALAAGRGEVLLEQVDQRDLLRKRQRAKLRIQLLRVEAGGLARGLDPRLHREVAVEMGDLSGFQVPGRVEHAAESQVAGLGQGARLDGIGLLEYFGQQIDLTAEDARPIEGSMPLVGARPSSFQKLELLLAEHEVRGSDLGHVGFVLTCQGSLTERSVAWG